MDFTLFRRRGNPRWFVEWFVDGQRHERELDTEDEGAAEQAAGILCGRAAAADNSGRQSENAQPQNYRVAHALEDLLGKGCSDNAPDTLRCYRQRAGHVVRLLGDVDLASLTLDRVQAYVDQRRVEQAAAETIRKELVVIRRALSLAKKRGLPCQPADEVLPRFRTRYVPRKTWLTAEQVEQLAERLKPHRRLFLWVAVYTGARLSELVRLDWADVDFAAAQIHLRGRKTERSDRFVPLHPRLSEMLSSARAVRGPVLQPWPSVRRDLAVACASLGLPVVTPNDLRRTFASWLVQSGETSYVVAQLLGHNSSTMVERVYGRLAGHTMRQAIGKLPNLGRP